MTLLGHIHNGVVVLDEPTPLPEGAAVRIEFVLDGTDDANESAGPKTLYERYMSIIGAGKGLPSDLAEQHDHYIHGTPKH